MKSNYSVLYSTPLNSYLEAHAYICIHTFHFNTPIHSIILNPCLPLQWSAKFYCYSAPTCLCLHILPHSHTFLSIYSVLSLKQHYLLVLNFIC